jgi:oxygen-dependent protoporphyrinogen oxidase
MSGSTPVVVIGAGISGLAVAWWLRRSGVDVIVLERESWVGGTMRTIEEDGWLVETGPNSALETTPLFGQMFDELGILDERRYANEASNKRYILRDGKLYALPMSPGAFFKTSLWSSSGKLRLLKEPFIGRATKEETIAEFVERRLGREFLDYAINPFVAGVYAGSPEQLSVRVAFPKLYALEGKYGGLVKGMIKGRKERKQRAEKAKDRAKMFSFAKGMQTFPNAIAKELGERLMLGYEVNAVTKSAAIDGYDRYPFMISYKCDGQTEVVKAQAVVLATPSHVASRIMRQVSTSLAAKLHTIYYPPVTEVFLGFRGDQFKRPLDGFGYLVPAKEKRSILGTIWSSSIFENRAPSGHVALTTFVGGARQPELADYGDADLIDLVVKEIHSIMQGEGRPMFSKIVRWKKAIPQYNLGYHEILHAVEKFQSSEPGFFLCSNYRGGIAVGDCLMSAEKVASRVNEYLQMEKDKSKTSDIIGA